MQWARDIAMHWLALVGHHCVGLASLCQTGAVHGSSWALARAALEHSAGVSWLIDTSPATLRQRCARAQLQTLDDARHLRNVKDYMAGRDPGTGAGPEDDLMNEIRLEIANLFDPAAVASATRDWCIEGERLGGWTERVATFAGEKWPYDALSARTHPTVTAFVNSMSLIKGLPTPATAFHMKRPELEDVVVTVLRAHMRALEITIDYHGWQARDELAAWRSEANSLLPGTL